MVYSEHPDLIDYNTLVDNKPKDLPKQVWIWDETLRDGEQTPGVALSADQKIEIAKLLDEIGVKIIAVGFPSTSPNERKAIQKVTQEGYKQAIIAAPARAVISDVEASIQAGAQEVPIFVAINDFRLKYQLKMSQEEVRRQLQDCIQYAKDHGVKADYICEDSTRTKIEHIVGIFQAALDVKVDKLCIADTVGAIRPRSLKYIIRNVIQQLWPRKDLTTPLSIHCHDDFGLATANTLAAVEEGITYPHVTVNGFGERAGNAPLEEVVMILEKLYGVKTGIRMEKLFDLAKLVEKHFGILLPAHKAIVGRYSFSHGSGIHVHGELEHPLSYEPIDPLSVGRKRKFHLGKYTGRHFVEYLLKQQNIHASADQIRKIADRVKSIHESHDPKQIKDLIRQLNLKLENYRNPVTMDTFWEIVKEYTKK